MYVSFFKNFFSFFSFFQYFSPFFSFCFFPPSLLFCPLLMKFHLCFVSFNNSFVVLLERLFGQVVCSPPQLRNSCSTKILSVFRSLVFLHSAFSLSHPDSYCVDTRPAHLLLGSRPLVSRLICIVDFSHISIWESFCIDRNDWRHQKLGVGTVQSIVSTQLPSSTLAVSAHPHTHGVAGRVEI